MAEAVFRCFFPGRVRLFGKTNGHSRESLATNLLGFKSQTGVIRRIHQNRIRYLKVGRNFMIPKEYLIDYLLSD